MQMLYSKGDNLVPTTAVGNELTGNLKYTSNQADTTGEFTLSAELLTPSYYLSLTVSNI